MTDVVTLERDARGVAHVTLNRPERHNAFNEAVIAELTAAFAAVGDARAVVLRGNGPSFCAGADLDWMKRAADWSEAENEADAMKLSDMLAAIDACPAPVIAVAQGGVYGGGVGLVACADLAVATPDAKFRLSEVRLGLTPATISPFVLAAMGARNARRYFTTAELFDAVTAHSTGLVHELADDALGAQAWVDAWLKLILEAAPGAVADAKALARDFAGKVITDDLRADSARRIAARRADPEGREGVTAFLSKRKPNWIPHA
ncbi:enoyl-CoA hydratase-related protein [Sphingoaurantiacus capsulatus]|uniref:Enoyl-CoA hydratase-related protein n=1 Tax=Sphingoaurantiacus capsulatus TaxID=1771310 RepID=A0ABV7XGL9_9SPHN